VPISSPRKNEVQDAFLQRCHHEMHEEYPDDKQRTAICFSQWRASKKPKKDKKKRVIL